MNIFTKLGVVFLFSIFTTGILLAQLSKTELNAKKQALAMQKAESQNADVSPIATKPISSNISTSKNAWDLQFSFDVDAVTGGSGGGGAECDGSYYYTTRWSSTLLFKYDLSGNLVEEFAIPGVTNLRDLAYDGTYMYGGAASTTIYEMDFENKTLISSINSPQQVRCIAYDSDNDAFWCSNWSTDITLVNRSGAAIGSIPAATHGLYSMYGTAYDEWSAGGPYLWIFDQGNGQGSSQYIHQFSLSSNMMTGFAYDVIQDVGNSNSIAGGLFTVPDIYPGTISIGGLLLGTEDMFFVYELANSGPPLTNDIAVQSILEPVTGVDLSNIEPITVNIKNFGTAPQSNFDVYFTFDGGAQVVETITATINSGETYNHTFATTVDLSAYAIYTFEACTDLAGDEDTSNDCKTKVVENLEPSYCTTSYSNQDDDWISNVQFSTINNPTNSEPGGYGDYTTISANIKPGKSYDIFVDVTVNGSWVQHTMVWIDWNRDYDFFDEGEAYDLGQTPGTAGTFTLTSTITVPEDALYGLTRMRVAEQYNNNPEPCTVYTYGEAEDYTINISDYSDFNLKIYLEGPFLANQMIPYLNLLGNIPLEQPYINQPWNYGGNEIVESIPNADIVDWVLVELRSSSGDASTAIPDSTIDMKACFLSKSGFIVDLDGISPISLNVSTENNLFIAIWHRNHLGVISNFPLVESAGVYNYDFTTSANQTFAGLYTMKEISPGIWGTLSGDGLNDIRINNEDKNEIWEQDYQEVGYKKGDFNMDGQVNLSDKEVNWKSNSGKSGMVPGGQRIGYGFSCGDSLFDSRNGQIYKTVQIGTQCWMAENLNIGTIINGSGDQTDNGVIEKYCYDNNSINCENYGGLYQWDEMMQYTSVYGSRGICPNGWYLPTDDEWKILEGNVDSYYGVGDPEWDDIGWRGFDAGLNLKSLTGWSSGNNGTDLFEFSALPGGYYNSGTFADLNDRADFWSSSEAGNPVWIRDINNNNVFRTFVNKKAGHSVRCIWGEYSNFPPNQPTNPTPDNGAINQPINSILSWNCSDPENNDLTYDVYFGETISLALVSQGQTETEYDPGILSYGTTYYWKIIAKDINFNSSESQTWNFTTEELIWSCGDDLTDSRDGQTYTTVQIGSQCWMAEN